MNGSTDDLLSLCSFGSGATSLNDSTVSSVFSFQALFGGQLSGRQYNDVRINPLFLECNTSDDVTLDVSARSLGRPDKSVQIDLHGGVLRRYSTPDIGGSDQHDSGISSDISSGDSLVGQATSPVIKNVQRNESGEIVLTLNRTPNSVYGSINGTAARPGVRTTNSFRVQKDFSSETRMVVNGNNISFVKDLDVGGKDVIAEMLPRPNGVLNNNHRFRSIDTTFSYTNEVFDGDNEDHYQTIDAVILPDPLDYDARGDNDSKSDNSDDLAQLYAQVRKGAQPVVDPVSPLYTSTIIVDANDGTESVASSVSLDEYDTGTMTLNPAYNNGKHVAERSLSTSATDFQHKLPLSRAYSDGDADDLDLPYYWNPNKIGKRRKKNRLSYSKQAKQPIETSPGKELKSILVSTPSNSRIFDDSTTRSVTSTVTPPLAFHSSLSEQKSVKFADDTVDNEHKAKHYRQEVIDLCEIHRQQDLTNFTTNSPVFIEEIPFDGSFSWPAQPRDSFIVDKPYFNNNLQVDKDASNVARCVCSRSCHTCKQPLNGTSPQQTDPSTTNIADGHITIANNTFDGGGTTCCHSVQCVECQSCLLHRRKQHLQRRRTIMRWSLLVFLIVIVVGLVIALAVHFGTKTYT